MSRFETHSDSLRYMGPTELVFRCDTCGQVATRVRVVEPGELVEGQRSPFSEIGLESRRLVVEINGLFSWSSRRTETAEEILEEWSVENLRSLQGKDSQFTASYCFDCGAFYCGNHSPFEKVVEPGGAPMYDFFYRSICPRGHARDVERI